MNILQEWRFQVCAAGCLIENVLKHTCYRRRIILQLQDSSMHWNHHVGCISIDLSHLCSGSCILVIMVKLTISSTRDCLSSRLLIGRLQPASSRYSQLTAMTFLRSSKDSAFAI